MSGRGHRGVVYLALDAEHQPVALKRSLLEWTHVDSDIARAAALESAHVPGVVSPVAWLRSGGSDWAVMEWVEGGHIGQFDQPISSAVAASIAASLARVVRAALAVDGLSKPLDLRPEHLRVTSEGQLSVLDLWQLRDPAREVGAFDAPERHRNRAADGSEVYAIGALLVRMLTGVDPDVSEGHHGRFSTARDLMLEDLRAAGVDAKLTLLIGRCWAFRARDRCTLEQVQTQLDALACSDEARAEWAKKALVTLGKVDAGLDGRIGSRVGGTDAEEFLRSEMMDVKPVSISLVPGATSVPHQEGDSDGFDLMAGSEPSPSITGQTGVPLHDDDSVSAHPPNAEPKIVTGSSSPVTQDEEGPAGVPFWAWIAAAGLGMMGVLYLVVSGASDGGAVTDAPELQAEPTRAQVEANDVPEPVPAHVIEPASAPEPVMTVDSRTVEAQDEPSAEVQQAEGSTVAPVARPAPVPQPPAPAPPPPPPQGQVSLVGDADAVWLVQEDKRFAMPGPVSAGTYNILATFDGDEISVGEVVVTPGMAVLLNCNSMFKMCDSN